MADKIPFEIQFEIIKRLPVKSRVVFRSASKAWKSMIDSPLFIVDHTNLHQHPRLLIRYEVLNTLSRNLFYYVDTDLKYVSIMDDGPLSQHEFETFSTLPLSFRLPYRHVLTFVGMSQGLLCLFGYYEEDDQYKDKAVVWNPSLRKSIAIDLPFENERGETVIGFGVRPDNLDPMIVMVGNVLQPYPLLVFTLSSRVWRVPRGNRPPMSIGFADLSPRVVTDNRCIYWKAHDRCINLIAAFDMVSEDFTEINLPNSVAHCGIGGFSISMIKDSLALVDYDYDGDDERICDVWVMVEDGVSKSITKLFTINTPYASLETVLGFRRNDQPIMETKMHWDLGSLELYEIRTGTIKNLGIKGERGSFFLSSYTETLLLLDQLDEQFIQIQLQ